MNVGGHRSSRSCACQHIQPSMMRSVFPRSCRLALASNCMQAGYIGPGSATIPFRSYADRLAYVWTYCKGALAHTAKHYAVELGNLRALAARCFSPNARHYSACDGYHLLHSLSVANTALREGATRSQRPAAESYISTVPHAIRASDPSRLFFSLRAAPSLPLDLKQPRSDGRSAYHRLRKFQRD